MYNTPINHTMLYFKENEEINSIFQSNFVNVPPEDTKEILYELKKILETTKIKDNGQISIYDKYISLYNVGLVRSKEYAKYQKTLETLKTTLRHILRYKFGSNAKAIIYDFNFLYNCLDIGFTNYGDYTDCESITFKKSNNNLYMEKDDTHYYGKILFEEYYNFLSNAYDELIKFNHLFTQGEHKVPMINSKLNVQICYSYIEIEKENPKNMFKPYFALEFFSDSITKKINSIDVQNIVKNNELEIFKKSFVMIENCPKWMQKELYEIRKNQIIEEKRIEEELKQQEEELRLKQEEQKLIEIEKENKKLQLIKKIFPFIKK